MIIGISAKKQHGKDTVAKIIQHLKYCEYYPEQNLKFEDRFPLPYIPDQFQIKRFADKLKDMVCLLIGCTREDLESEDFKNTPLGDEWDLYRFHNKTFELYSPCYVSMEALDVWRHSREFLAWDRENPAIEILREKMTPRRMLQLLGTDCGRNIIHPNVWKNATLVDYKPNGRSSKHAYRFGEGWRFMEHPEVAKEFWNIDVANPKTHPLFFDVYPNWIIPDVRFPNEVEGIEELGGIVYRVHRPGIIGSDFHESEVALDHHDFGDRLIINNGTIDSLVQTVTLHLQKDKIIPYA